MLPATCPRCNRPNVEWAVERDQGRAGCPCGEVITLLADDDVPPLARPPLSRAPRRPASWTEQSGAEWQAQYQPSLRRALLLFAVLLLLALPRALLHGAAHRRIAVGLLMFCGFAVFAAVLAATHVRRWRLSFAGGTFRVDARGSHVSIPLDDILGFYVERTSKRRSRADFNAHRLCVVRASGDPVYVPLFVEGDAEAQFVSDRANALLATGGRDVDFGYRGRAPTSSEARSVPAPSVRVEELRTRVDVPVRVATEEEEPASEPEEELRRREP